MCAVHKVILCGWFLSGISGVSGWLRPRPRWHSSTAAQAGRCWEGHGGLVSADPGIMSSIKLKWSENLKTNLGVMLFLCYRMLGASQWIWGQDRRGLGGLVLGSTRKCSGWLSWYLLTLIFLKKGPFIVVVSSSLNLIRMMGHASDVSLCVNWIYRETCHWISVATGFRSPSATVVSAEPFSHGTGTLRCLQKEIATYRHWTVSLWRLSNPVSWQNWMAAYHGYTLRMKT